MVKYDRGDKIRISNIKKQICDENESDFFKFRNLELKNNVRNSLSSQKPKVDGEENSPVATNSVKKEGFWNPGKNARKRRSNHRR